MNRTIALTLALALVAAGGPAIAADTNEAELLEMNLEQLMDIPVRAASGFDQRTSEAPSSVTILTKDDLRGFGHRTLADALSAPRLPSHPPGVFTPRASVAPTFADSGCHARCSALRSPDGTTFGLVSVTFRPEARKEVGASVRKVLFRLNNLAPARRS